MKPLISLTLLLILFLSVFSHVSASLTSDFDEMEAFIEALNERDYVPYAPQKESTRVLRIDEQDAGVLHHTQTAAAHTLRMDEQDAEQAMILSVSPNNTAQQTKAITFPQKPLTHGTKVGVIVLACIIFLNLITIFCICSCSALSQALGLTRKNFENFKILISPELKHRLLDGIHFQRQAIVRKIRFNKALAISVFVLTSYILACTIFYAIAQPEWGIVGAMYFAITTVSLVGFGDFAVSHWYTKIFTMMMIITGMIALAYALGLAASIVVHNQSEKLALALKQASKKGGMSNVARARAITIFLQLSFAVVSFFFIWIVGSCVYCFLLEDWDFLDSMFYTLTALSSVGYGTLHSTTDASRVFTIIYILFGTSTVAISIGIISNLVLEFYQWSAVQNVRRRPLASLETMDLYDKKLDRIEFLVWSLVKSGKVEERQCRALLDMFEDADVNQRGYLDASQLRDMQLPVELEEMIE